jgi:hypothetical protein
VPGAESTGTSVADGPIVGLVAIEGRAVAASIGVGDGVAIGFGGAVRGKDDGAFEAHATMSIAPASAWIAS